MSLVTSIKPVMKTFILGIIVGYLFSYLNISYLINQEIQFNPLRSNIFESLLDFQNESTKNLDPNSDFNMINQIEVSIAEELFKKVRVLCWVQTTPKNHAEKAIHIKNTWGRRCNKLLFMSSKEDPKLDTIVFENVTDGRDSLWIKTREAFKYIYEHHFDEADWFMKADDDTYVIVENLRYFLKDYDTNSPIYFGCRFKHGEVKQGYMSGGAGYVLSKTALQRFIKDAYNNSTICSPAYLSLDEDWEIGRCLANVGVEAGDTRDSFGRYRFSPFGVESHINDQPDPKYWYWQRIFYPQNLGLNCCSTSAITYHYIDPRNMYVLEYLIYHLRPYGVQPLPQVQLIPNAPSTTTSTTLAPTRATTTQPPLNVTNQNQDNTSRSTQSSSKFTAIRLKLSTTLRPQPRTISGFQL